MNTIEEALKQLNQTVKVNQSSTEFDALPLDDESFNENLNEDWSTSLPAHVLPENEILDFLGSVPKAGPGVPPPHFKVGYMTQVEPKAEFKEDGRGHTSDKPIIRVVKVGEYANCYCERYIDAKATKNAFAAQGRSLDDLGARRGFHPADNGMRAVFQSDKDNSYAFGALIDKNVTPKTKYYLSIDGGDFIETPKSEIAQYMNSSFTAPFVQPDDGSAQRTQTFKFAGIYLIGNKGSSIL